MRNLVKLTFLFPLLLFCACQKKPVQILVERIEITPSPVTFFVGDQVDVSIECYPQNATNLKELTTHITMPSVASFQNGKLAALAPGTCYLVAECGKLSHQAKILVYPGYFTKAGTKYGVDAATGYLFYMGESTPQELQLTLTYNEPNGETQNFWIHLSYSDLGKTINFMENMGGNMVAIYKNNNEDGYTVAYPAEDGTPVIKLADWGDTDARLTMGTLKVEDLGASTYSVEADFALSNGYTFTASWEGTASMKKE